jgi:hypothetical protein
LPPGQTKSLLSQRLLGGGVTAGEPDMTRRGQQVHP